MPGSTRPRAHARSSTFARRMPPPSSAMRIITLPDSCHADSVTVPAAACPRRRARRASRARDRAHCARDASAGRDPLDHALVELGVAATTRARRPCRAARRLSRTTRRKREKVSPIGTILSCSVPLRISSTSRPIWPFARSERRGRPAARSSDAPAPAITSSPSRLINASSGRPGRGRTGSPRRPRAASRRGGRRRCAQCRRRPPGAAASAAGAGGASCTSAATGSIDSAQSSRTKSNAASSDDRSAQAIAIRIARWQASGTSASSGGIASTSHSTRSTVPMRPRYATIASGSMPLRKVSVPNETDTRQRGGVGPRRATCAQDAARSPCRAAARCAHASRSASTSRARPRRPPRTRRAPRRPACGSGRCSAAAACPAPPSARPRRRGPRRAASRRGAVNQTTASSPKKMPGRALDGVRAAEELIEQRAVAGASSSSSSSCSMRSVCSRASATNAGSASRTKSWSMPSALIARLRRRRGPPRRAGRGCAPPRTAGRSPASPAARCALGEGAPQRDQPLQAGRVDLVDRRAVEHQGPRLGAADRRAGRARRRAAPRARRR